jgi:hypothetical protein
MIKEEQYEQLENSDRGMDIKTLIGTILITIGIIIAIWVFLNIFRIFTNPKNIEVFRQIINEKTVLKVIHFEGKNILIPDAIINFLAYLICIMLLGIAGTIAIGFISGGVNLLQSNFLKLQLLLAQYNKKSSIKMDEIKEIIKKKNT